MTEWGPRHGLAVKRLQSILRSHGVASSRILEQKIADAGPTNQRINPHILTEARQALVKAGIISVKQESGVPWYHLTDADAELVKKRLKELTALHRQTVKREFVLLLGQALEIAAFRALESQDSFDYFGHFKDLDAHDDSKMYYKTEPPSEVSRYAIPGGKKLDFLLQDKSRGYAGIELKNIREWIYPDREEIREVLLKCCSLDAIPVLISRRIHYSTFSVLNPCGVLLHQNFNQLYPSSAQELADKVRDKTLLGYHDVRTGNQPDKRLVRFIHEHLPKLLPDARKSFDTFKDRLLWGYANGDHNYRSFAARVKRRLRGENEDGPQPEPEEYYEEPDYGE